MADLHTLYKDFNEKITLSASKRDQLIRGRDALRKIIIEHLSGIYGKAPSFYMQGSFSMKTTINPIGNDEFDLDDGIYLQNFDQTAKEAWPDVDDVHKNIIDAVKGHTKSDPEDKTSCVRVRYENGYHIDLPSYIVKDNICYLASKNDGWTESDPKAFKNWFLSYVVNNPRLYGEQLRSTVKYVKAWRDYNDVNLESITITILVTNSFQCYPDRDDLATLNTVESILRTLENQFTCKKPVIPYEDLLEEYSNDDKEKILKDLRKYLSSLREANVENSVEKASNKLKYLYGDRFPKGADENDDSYVSTPAPGIIGNDGRSA